MSSFKKYIIFALLVCVCGATWFAYGVYIFLEVPPATVGERKYFDVKPGAALAQIAEELQRQGLVTDARKFMWLVRYKNMAKKVQAGRFALNTGWKPEEILTALVNGKPVMERITIPEGLTWWQTGRLLEKEGFARFDDFKDVITDPAFLRHYGIPFANAEGFLMPDTYLLKKPDSPITSANMPQSILDEAKIRDEWKANARAVAGRLVDNFWRKAAPLWPATATGSGVVRYPPVGDLKKWVTLASIVEKETALDQERGAIAGVYANRINRNMLLQADPTVIYGLGSDFTGHLLRRHLEDDANPYNTYRKPGLPPGPICSFGAAALKAAVNPQKHDFLYFVAKTDGGEHSFSKTLSEHNKAVEDYRRQKRAIGGKK